MITPMRRRLEYGSNPVGDAASVLKPQKPMGGGKPQGPASGGLGPASSAMLPTPVPLEQMLPTSGQDPLSAINPMNAQNYLGQPLRRRLPATGGGF